jgi:high affinity Mn2+ porin
VSYRATSNGSANEQLEYVGTLRGRLGYSMGSWTPYVTGGFAWASTRFSRTDSTTGNEDATPGQLRTGYALGGGVDYALGRRWSARFEYLYTNLGLTGFSFASPARYDSQYDLNRFRVGLNYHFGESNQEATKEGSDDDYGPGTWELHGQTTFIFQGYPAFNAPYSGANSLPPGGQSRETWTVSAFLGVRLWQGGELYYNPELLQGFGVGSTTGAGGYPQGEAQKSNFPFPQYSTSRLFLRQEIGLGGEREKVERVRRSRKGRVAVAAGRQVLGPRPVRRQRLRRGSATRLSQLVDLGIGRLRLSGRPAGPHLGFHRRDQSGALGGPRGVLPGRRPAQLQHVRHGPVVARRLRR